MPFVKEVKNSVRRAKQTGQCSWKARDCAGAGHLQSPAADLYCDVSRPTSRDTRSSTAEEEVCGLTQQPASSLFCRLPHEATLRMICSSRHSSHGTYHVEITTTFNSLSPLSDLPTISFRQRLDAVAPFPYSSHRRLMGSSGH